MLKKNTTTKSTPKATGAKPAPANTTKPAPSKPAPSKPAPAKTTGTKPAPSKPAPSKPAPSKPAPSKPAEDTVLKEAVLKTEVKQDKTKLETMLSEHNANIRKYEADIIKLQEKIASTKKAMEATYRDASRLKRIRSMINLVEQPYEWSMIKRKASEYSKYEWAEEHKYKTAVLDLMITLKESSVAKKYKFSVEVSGRKVLPGINDTDIGDVDYFYIRNKYMEGRWNDVLKVTEYYPRAEGGEELNRSYETLAEAKKAVKHWQTKLVEDHKELIDEEMELFMECKS